MLPPTAEVPETDEEAELWMAMNFKTASSVAMKEAIEWVMLCNKEQELKRRIIRDLVVCKRAAIRPYHDNSGSIITEYVDHADVIVPYSKTDDYSNIKYIAVQKKMQISDIRKMTNELSKDDLEKIATTYMGRNNNPVTFGSTGYMSNDGYYSQNTAWGSQPYSFDNFYVDVLEFWFLTIDTEIYSERKLGAGGVTSFKRRDPNWRPTDEAAKKTAVTEKQVKYVYGGYWVENSEYLFNYGKQKNIPRQREAGMYSTDCQLPILMIAPNIYDGQNKSFVERMIPFEDNINNYKNKMQQLVLATRPPGSAIDLAGIKNTLKGQGKIDPRQVIELYNAQGVILYDSEIEGGLRNINHNVVSALNNGLPNDMIVLINLINAEIGRLNDVIGYNDAVDGTTPAADSLVGVQKNAILASNNSLRPINLAYTDLFSRLGRRISLMIQDQIEYNFDSFSRAIGSYGANVIKYGKKLALHQFNIDIEYLPTEAEKAEVLMFLDRSLEAGRLESSDAIRVKNVLNKNARMAEQLLVILEKKNAKNRIAETQAAAQANADQQAMGAEAAAQAKIQEEQVLNELKKDFATYETSEKIRLDDAMTENKKTLIAFEADVTVATTPPTTTPAI